MVFTKCIKCIAIILIPIIIIFIIILWTDPIDQPINFHADHGSFHIELNNSTVVVRFDVIDTGSGIYVNASNSLDFWQVKNITTYNDQDEVLKIYETNRIIIEELNKDLRIKNCSVEVWKKGGDIKINRDYAMGFIRLVGSNDMIVEGRNHSEVMIPRSCANRVDIGGTEDIGDFKCIKFEMDENSIIYGDGYIKIRGYKISNLEILNGEAVAIDLFHSNGVLNLDGRKYSIAEPDFLNIKSNDKLSIRYIEDKLMIGGIASSVTVDGDQICIRKLGYLLKNNLGLFFSVLALFFVAIQLCVGYENLKLQKEIHISQKKATHKDMKKIITSHDFISMKRRRIKMNRKK